MAKGILSNFAVFINHHFRWVQFSFEKRYLSACLIMRKDAVRLENNISSASLRPFGNDRLKKTHNPDRGILVHAPVRHATGIPWLVMRSGGWPTINHSTRKTL
jgi:hypothetical protein